MTMSIRYHQSAAFRADFSTAN